MRHISFLFIISTLVFVTGCASGMPQLFWETEGDKPDYARSSGITGASETRAPLNVPPELREELSVPQPDQVAVNAASGNVKLSELEKKAIAGKAVSLDARNYEKTPAEVFSAVVDGMTSLNMPVESVDSASGTITTDWVRITSPTMTSALAGVFGGGVLATRYRLIVRVFRLPDGDTQLQIRSLGQQFANQKWTFKEMKRKVQNELFTATEERLGLLAEQPASTPADDASEAPASEVPAAKP